MGQSRSLPLGWMGGLKDWAESNLKPGWLGGLRLLAKPLTPGLSKARKHLTLIGCLAETSFGGNVMESLHTAYTLTAWKSKLAVSC